MRVAPAPDDGGSTPVVVRIVDVVENVVTVLLVLAILAVVGVAATTVLRLYRGQG